MRFARHLSKAVAVIVALGASNLAALAHPHVFAEARLDVMVNPDHTVKALRHLWRFDDAFSATVVMEFDQNADGKLDEAELQEVAKTVHSSISEYKFFQLVTADGKNVEMVPPPNLIADFQDEQFIVLFESTPKEPLKLAGKIDFGVYDPTFYTAIEFADDDRMAVVAMPDGCSKKVIRPDPDEALAQNQASLTEAFFNDPAGTNMSKIFATKLELTCKASG